MNAAILLVSSAWMAAQTPDVIVPVQHAQPAACGNNNCCNDSCHQGICAKLRERCRGLFQRDHCDSCSQPRCQTFHRCERPQCERQHCERQHCERPHHERCCQTHDRCQTHNACDPCGHTSLLERIRNAFHRDRGCNDCCTTSGSAPSAEPLKDQPKKMPKTKAEEARVITTPAQAPLPAIQNAPAIQSAPAPALAPRVLDNDTRNPF